MLTYNKFISLISPELYREIQRYVKKDFIGEAQVGRVLLNSFGIDENSGDYLINIGACRLLFVLAFLDALDISKHKLKSSEALRRLISSNGDEAFYEFCSHSLLKSIFPSYRVSLPLFGSGADGTIPVENFVIPVEIKSRFPEKYELIEEFSKNAYNILHEFDNAYDVYARIEIKAIAGLTKDVRQQEQDFISRLVKTIDYSNILYHPKYYIFERQNEGFSYTLMLSFTSAEKERNVFGLTKGDMMRFDEQQPIYSATGCQAIEGGFFGGINRLEVVVSDEVKQALAYLIFTQCIKSAKNLPDEPRVIVIYTTHGWESIRFVSNIVDAYIERHDRTMIILLSASFTNDMKMKGNIMYGKWGSSLTEMILDNASEEFKLSIRKK